MKKKARADKPPNERRAVATVAGITAPSAAATCLAVRVTPRLVEVTVMVKAPVVMLGGLVGMEVACRLEAVEDLVVAGTAV